MTDASGQEFVLRRPPLHGVLPTAHDMGREHRIIEALGPTPVPVPVALASCPDPDVIGAPFYVMSYVAGTVLNDIETAEAALDVGARAHAGESLVDALVALHAVDIDAVGLGDLARRDELIRRQLKRWHAQFDASKTRAVPGVDRVHELLAARIPEQVESTVVHGDFRLGNCVVDDRGDIQAVLDWEICTLGDPRADVGYVLATWAEPGDPLRADNHNPTLAAGFTTRAKCCSTATRRHPDATSPTSRSSSPSRSGGSRASSRACWPARSRAPGVTPAPTSTSSAGGWTVARSSQRNTLRVSDPAVCIGERRAHQSSRRHRRRVQPRGRDGRRPRHRPRLLLRHARLRQAPAPDFGPGTEGAWLQLGTAQVHLGTVTDMGPARDSRTSRSTCPPTRGTRRCASSKRAASRS